jgi:hypothetical protein
VVKLKKIILAFLVLCLIAVPSFADDEYLQKAANEVKELISQFDSSIPETKLNQPIDFSQVIEQNAKGAALKNIKNVVEAMDPSVTADISIPDEATGFIAQSSANWLITRALVYGFTGLGEAEKTINSWVTFKDNNFIGSIKKGSPAWMLAKSADLASKAATIPSGGIAGGISDMKFRVETDGETLMVPLEAQIQIKDLLKVSKFASGLKNVPGIQAEDSIYDRSLAISRVIWSVIFVVQIIWTAYKMLIAGENKDMITTIFKGMFVFISLFFIREIAMIGVSISTALGDAMLGGTDVAHAVSDISEIVELKQNIVSASSSRFLKGFAADLIITISGLVARAVVYVMFILSDVMVAITIVIGPWMIVLSMLPFCENWISHWVKSFITFLFYRPLACLLCVVLYIVGLTGLDVGLVELMITCIVFVMAAVKVPSMAENMGGAAAAVGAGMTGMVGKGLKAGASLGAHAAGAGAVVAGAKILGSLKDKATPPKES